MEKFNSLHIEYPEFVFREYRVTTNENTLHIEYHYEIPELTAFRSTFSFPLSTIKIDIQTLTPFIFSLGMVEMISYWKATCSKVIRVECGALEEKALHFWKELYWRGLGEFRYQNNIDISKDSFVSFEFTGEQINSCTHTFSPVGNLIPVGGGKDSIVTLELLKEECNENIIFLFNPRAACMRTAEAAGYSAKQIITIDRTLDKRLLDLNTKGFLNGHTPFSALLAFSSLLVAALYQRKFIVLSNEGSASEGNIMGQDVNHQYSKSYHFEKSFRDYQKKYLSDEFEYFSLLRPLNELQIASLFSKFKGYYPIFRSCNAGHYTDSWCANCSKCLFTYLMLVPFVSKEDRVQIFGRDLFNDASLLPILKSLYRDDLVKPFDCVGTREEVKAAIFYALQSQEKDTPLFSALDRTDFTNDLPSVKTLLKAWNSEHMLSPQFEKILRDSLQGGTCA